MTFFYDLNKRLADLAKKQDLTESAEPVAERATGDYSAKKARAGKDIGKPGKMFSKIAKSAGKEYGSKERGEKVAGAVLAKLRAKESVDNADSISKVIDSQSENMMIRALRAQGLTDEQIKRKIKNIKLGKEKDPRVKESEVDESALQAYLGKKKYGETGMKALQKAGREGASKETMAKIRAQHDKMDEQMADEGNAFTGALAKTPKGGKFKVGGKEFTDTSSLEEVGQAPMTAKQKSFAKLAPPKDKITFADKIAGAKKEVDEMLGDVAAEAIKSAVAKKKEPRSKGTAFDPEYMKQQRVKKDAESHSRYDVKDTGYSKRYTRKAEPEAADEPETSDQPKKKGRPKGPDKGPERTTKGAWKHKGARKEKTEEDLDTDGVMMTRQSNMSSEGVDPADRGEYDREGEMAKQQIHTIMSAAKKLHSMLGDDENMPEWVQKKITLAKEYIDGVADYMASRDAEDREEKPIAEKAKSKKQQRFMGMVHAAQKGEKPASKEVAKVAKEMPKKSAKDYAATKHKGLPEKVKAKKDESVEETSEAPKEKKSSGGFQFGKGVYESFDKKYKQLLSEGMNVSVNMSTGADGQPTKNITVSAEGEDAEALAKLLQMAGIGGHDEACSSCGKAPCGCDELDENSPDWPTNTETSDNALQYSGGLNKPKSTGQTTTPVIASQLRRQVSMEEGVELERSLFKLYQNYKAQ